MISPLESTNNMLAFLQNPCYTPFPGEYYMDDFDEILFEDDIVKKERVKHRTTGQENHGEAYTSLYHIWANMIQRCYNPKAPNYYLYGAKGIKVCEEWKNSYKQFSLDIGERPSLDHSLDRYPNKNGDYEKDNVRWATSKEQANNRDDTYLITYKGKTQPLTTWATELGLDRRTIWSRIILGWTVEKVLGAPIRTWNQIEYNGRVLTMGQWAKELGLPYETLRYRINKGWTLKEAFEEMAVTRGNKRL